MDLVKEKQGVVMTVPKRWSFKLIKHFADTTRISPSACPAGRCPKLEVFYFEKVADSAKYLRTCSETLSNLRLADYLFRPKVLLDASKTSFHLHEFDL